MRYDLADSGSRLRGSQSYPLEALSSQRIVFDRNKFRTQVAYSFLSESSLQLYDGSFINARSLNFVSRDTTPQYIQLGFIEELAYKRRILNG
jgi:hypothetical protein